MFLMYVDESGDCGMHNSPSRYFILTGIIVHELRWQIYLDQMIKFRQRLKIEFGIRLNEEIHASAMISKPGDLKTHSLVEIFLAQETLMIVESYSLIGQMIKN